MFEYSSVVYQALSSNLETGLITPASFNSKNFSFASFIDRSSSSIQLEWLLTSSGAADVVKSCINGAVQNNGGTVTVSGKVNAKLEEDEGGDIANGIDITGGTTTIGKDVTVDAKPSTIAAYIHTQSHRTDGEWDDAHLNIGGNISIHGSGSTYNVDHDTVDFYNPTGVSVLSGNEANVHVNVAGKIDANSNGVACGIEVRNRNDSIDKENPLQVNITSGSISATGNRIMD